MCDSNHMTFWKRQNYGENKKIRVEGRKVNGQSTEDLGDSEILCMMTQ